MAFRVSLPMNTSIPDTHLTPGTKLNTIAPLTSQITEDKALFETTDTFGRLIQ